MIIRAKTDSLFTRAPISEQRKSNTALNLQEQQSGATILKSKPQRIILELTNACNINCIMCGRNASEFKLTSMKYEWFEKLIPIFSETEEVTLMGWGEPTVHPRFVDMLRECHNHGIRKYFCTNGMKLDELHDIIFETEVEVFAVSLDGIDAKTNQVYRAGLDFERVINALKTIVDTKSKNKLSYPHINFVMTVRKSNIEQLPDMVDLAADIGLNEVKAVIMTVFNNEQLIENLWNEQELVNRCFKEAEKRASASGVLLKLPYKQGDDVAGDMLHKDCYAPWRDLFLRSDGYTTLCMHTPVKLFHIDKYTDFDSMWNSNEYIDERMRVNDANQMDDACKRCYHSTFTNWNKPYAYNQMGNLFSPEWEKEQE
ncbi:MAG: radical SAM protein [Oscillospiraceae bacterium]|jgi:MoaA/NifB/PqqE/SkfB family radical SAM enzyme|nr:radical SAM protein [Oscillospiraceae bacterium]